MAVRPSYLSRAMDGEVVTVPLLSVRPGESPRLNGEDKAHIARLAESDAALPPILVHRPTMRVIDGMHRLLAARNRGKDNIEVQFFVGTEQEAFVLAVQLNIAHGLPLSLEDRKAAAVRILRSQPQWSDRRISSIVGLAPSTVGGIRSRSTGQIEQSNARIGRDGRERPLSGVAGRMSASDLFKENPTASIREIAAAAGISTSTAQNVRERMRAGKDPIPTKLRKGDLRGKITKLPGVSDNISGKISGNVPKASSTKLMPAMAHLKMDPSLRHTDAGRVLLRLLEAQTTIVRDPTQLATAVPSHSVDMIATLAREIGDSWKVFAESLEVRVQVADNESKASS